MASGRLGRRISAAHQGPRPPFLRLLLFLVVLIPVTAAGVIWHDAPGVRLAREVLNDQIAYLVAETPILPLAQRPIATVDIDDATFTGLWGGRSPATRPSDLTPLMIQVLKSHPAYLLVDIDLSYDTGDEVGQEALKTLLYDKDRIGSTKILFLKTRELGVTDAGDQMIFRTSFLDEALAKSPLADQYFWFSGELPVDEDGVARHLSAWRTGCLVGDDHRRAVTVFSPGYLIALLEHHADQAKIARLGNALAHLSLDRNCAPSPGPVRLVAQDDLSPFSVQDALWLGKAQQRTPIEASRIAFAVPSLWKPPGATTRDRVSGKPTNDDAVRPTRLPRLSERRISQGPYAGRNAMQAVSAESLLGPDPQNLTPLLQDAAVLIIRTDAQNEDLLDTPLGKLPGGGLLAHTINTVQALPHPLRARPLLVIAATICGLLMLGLAVFLDLKGAAFVIGLAVFSLATSVATVLLMPRGLWLEASLPVFVAGVTKTILEAVTPHILRKERNP